MHSRQTFECYLPKTVASSLYDFRYSKSLIKLCGLILQKVCSLSKEIVINASSRKTAQRDLKHDSRPILQFLNQKARKPHHGLRLVHKEG